MKLTRLAVGRPVGVTMCVFAFLLLSAIAFQNIGLDLLPNLELPIAAIAVVSPGADPATIETTLTAPIEDAVSGVSGIQRIRSMSMENVSLVLVDFEWGSNMDASMRDLQTSLNTVAPLFPTEATAPIVMQTDPSQWPLMIVSVSGTGDIVELTRQVEQYVLPRLQGLPGVASVEILGGAHEEISVRYDSDALQAHNVTPTLLYQILRFQNTVVPAGAITEDGQRYQVRAGRQILTLDDLRSQPIAQRQATQSPALGLFGLGQSLPVQLREVADVGVERTPEAGATRINGSEAVLLRVLKASGANTVTVADRIRAEASAIQRTGDTGLTFDVITDQAELIRDSLRNVATSALIGGALAVAVLFFFLRSVTSLLVIAVAIPLSLVGVGTALYFAGVTLNLMSLGGLAISVGMLVDNAIVVLENMARHRALGKTASEAAADGGSEVGAAIVAATLTSLVVFIPLTFVKDLTGQLFKDLALTVSASLTISLIVALTVVPAAYARWEGRRKGVRHHRRSAAFESPVSIPPGLPEAAATSIGLVELPADAPASNQASMSALQRFYARTLRAWLARRWLGPIVAGLMVVALIVLPLGHPWTFLPEMDGGLITVSLSLPPGSPLSETLEVVQAYEQAIEKIPDVKTVLAAVGDQGSQTVLSLVQLLGAHEASLTLVLAPHSERAMSANEIAHEISRIRIREDVSVTVHADRTAAALGDDYFPGVTLHLTGPDLDSLRSASETIVARLENIPGLSKVATSLGDPQPELLFRVTDRSFQGILAGGEPLTAGQVGLALRNHMTGMVATHIVHEGARLPVVLRPGSDEVDTSGALQEFRVPGAALGGAGARPILGRIADTVEIEGPVTVDRLNRQRLLTIRAELDGIGLAQGRALVVQALEGITLPPGVSAEIGGIHRVIDETVSQMAAVLLIGVLLVYAVMATQFESLKQPLILMLTVPLALVGAVAALRLVGQPFSVPAAIGLIVLVGISVNNGIVMIDYINRLRKEGFSPLEAVVQGSVVRLRPILMTAVTTFLGLIPLALSRGQGSEFQLPLAIALIGGLVTSTTLTLFVLPSILMITTSRRSLRPVLTLLALCAIVALAAPGDARASESVWSHDAMVGAIVSDHDSPTYLLGAGTGANFGAARLSASVAGGIEARAPLVIGLQSSLQVPATSDRVELFASADVWLRPAPAHESTIWVGWAGAESHGRLGLAHSAGVRTVHPWSGRVPLSDVGTWEASFHLEEPPGTSIAWDRDLHVWFTENQPPRWLLMNGVTARAEDVIQARARAGLLLQSGKYVPLFVIDTLVTLLPRGEVELTIGPHSGAVPLGWPAFGVGYRGRIGGFDVTSRAELGAAQSGFKRRGYVAVQRFGNPYALQFAWTEMDSVTGTVSLHISF